MFSDDFLHDPEEDFIADMEGWLKKRAASLCNSSVTLSRIEDVKQEGRITLWQTYKETQNPEAAMAKAYYRMKDIAWRDKRQTGMAQRPVGTLQPKDIESVDKMLEAGVWDLIAAADSLPEVEWAYHHGEIMEAINALTPKQRTYIYARFWCGMDTADGAGQNFGVKEARKANPLLKRDILWTGSKTAKGSKKILAEKLEHLRALIRT